MIYDAIIIGAGPAGMSAALYLLRDGKKVLILEKETIGGSIASTPLIENYPGVKAVSGSELTDIMFDQIDELGVEFELEKVTNINVLEDNIKEVITEDNKYLGKVLIIASGSAYRTLNLPNEDKLIGHGIHFCVACDGAFYKGKDVAIIGGGNSAVINAYSMSKIAKKVYILQKMDKLTCEKDLINKIESTDNVEIMYNVDVLEYLGDDELTGLSIKVDGKKKKLKVDGVFLNIGLIPQNKFAYDVIDLDERDYVISTNTETKVPGLYVIGDSRTKKYSQVTIATADGTIAALNAIEYLNG
ncbi:MAG: NAD(P)/FAD-dependent oxidoreductase [Bacilli bacterium]|nr:NAD(P)/FAD-dependent oxidoreductase [Bacilli bacterium]